MSLIIVPTQLCFIQQKREKQQHFNKLERKNDIFFKWTVFYQKIEQSNNNLNESYLAIGFDGENFFANGMYQSSKSRVFFPVQIDFSPSWKFLLLNKMLHPIGNLFTF